jgi:hypothetical protein
MRSERFGAFFHSRLSFLRSMLREIRHDNWTFERTFWEVDSNGVGLGIYTARGPHRNYSLICFANDLDPSQRTDRVIAEAWDATFTLFDGEPTPADIARLYGNVPRQEAGRFSRSELVLSRANRSVRLFDHVVECLAAGIQPDLASVESTGYLMRTTAVYCNGKFGLCDRDHILDRKEFYAPFRAEMLSVWLIRVFTVDIVEHLAAARATGKAVKLDAGLRRRIGVGNSTGLGMAPFLIKHPSLIHRWVSAKETALARVRSVRRASPSETDCFNDALRATQSSLIHWLTGDEIQRKRIEMLGADLDKVSRVAVSLAEDFPWDRLYQWAEENLSIEAQECVASLLLEPYGDIIDDLSDSMAVDEEAVFRINGVLTCGEIQQVIARDYDWALSIDFRNAESQARFWYVSEEKLEPRLGERAGENYDKFELPLAIARDVTRFYEALQGHKSEALASFLLMHPEFRHVARRVLTVARFPYGEIRENLVSTNFRPIDLLRCKLAFFGAMRFDPRSDRWLRITLFQGAPFPTELYSEPNDDRWVYAYGRPEAA